MKSYKILQHVCFGILLIALLGFPNITEATEKNTGYLQGSAFAEDGTPLSGAFVYIFNADRKLPDDGVFWRAPDYIAGQLDRHGKFDIEIPAGEYYLTIIKRASGKVWGPLQEGDIYYLHRVAVVEKKMIIVKVGEETELGPLEGKRFAGRGVAGFSEYTEIATVSGILTDREGKPIAGAYILVYDEPGRLGPPLFSGGPSRVDGSYKVTYYEEGTYYIIARSSARIRKDAKGISQPGVLIGVYGGSRQYPLVIKKGDAMTGVDIVLVPNSK